MSQTLAPRSLPYDIEDISKIWLTEALSARYPGTVVTSVHLGTVIAGTATKVRLLLGYNDAGHRHGLPPTMWLKGGFIIHDHTYYDSFVSEVDFFCDWAPQLPINIPKSFYQGEDGRQGLVLLEDLLSRNVVFGYATSPITVEQQMQTLELLASMHAKWWRSPLLDGLRAFSTVWEAADKVVMRMLDSAYFNKCLSERRGAGIVGAYRDPERVAAGLRSQWRKSEAIEQCFSHGDAHLGNMYFERDGSPGFLDWQAWQRGPYMHDVAYSIIGNLTVEDRRANQHDLLAHYLKHLSRQGVAKPPSIADAWEAFRRHAMHGFMWFVTPVEMQPAEVSEAEGDRFGAAVVDLDTFGALGV